MHWTEWVLIGLAIYAVCDIIASIWTARVAEKALVEVIEEEAENEEEKE